MSKSNYPSAPEFLGEGISDASHFLALLKPRVMSLVIFTAFIGAYLAPGQLHPYIFFVSVLCIAVGAGASGAYNMWYERDIDAVMRRTNQRPLPLGLIKPEEALVLATMLSVGSVTILALATNLLAAGLLAFTIFFYAVVYTIYLKRRTPQNIVIGGAAGAFPPMIGWAAVTGNVSLESLVLFSIIFLWTPPHFWALALCCSQDYQAARIPMLPIVNGVEHTKNQILLYTLALIATSVLPYVIEMSGMVYLVVVLPLDAAFLYFSWQVRKSADTAVSKRLFVYSIFYLFVLYSVMLIDRMVG